MPLAATWENDVKCGPGTGLVAFLKLLCATAVRLHCVADRNIDVDAYLTSAAPPVPWLESPPPVASDRWQSYPYICVV